MCDFCTALKAYSEEQYAQALLEARMFTEGRCTLLTDEAAHRIAHALITAHTTLQKVPSADALRLMDEATAHREATLEQQRARIAELEQQLALFDCHVDPWPF